MAPEVLDSSLNFEKFFTFKSADMFSSSYIIWEMLHVCQVDSEYRPVCWRAVISYSSLVLIIILNIWVHIMERMAMIIRLREVKLPDI